MKILVSVALLAAFLAGQAPRQKPAPAEATPGFQSITAEDCKNWLGRLASDDCEGRESGTPGFQKAANMVAAHFREHGLTAVGDKDSEGNPSYFQNVPFVAAGLDAERARFEVTGGKDPIRLRAGEGFGATGLGTLDVHGPLHFVVVPANHGKLPEFDIKGKIVIVLAFGADGAPARVPGGIVADLRKPGPAAVVRADDVIAARGMTPTDPVRKDMQRLRADRAPTVAVSTAVAESLAKAGGHDVASLIAKAKAAGGPQSVATKLSAKIELATKIVDIPVPNVVGCIEGSDPVLKKEFVIVGSHLDHLGRLTTGEICNGADDDASGTTGILAIARAFTKNGRAPKRSILFLTFCGEEKGLWGSDWYVDHPIFPLGNVIAELQMDMIGRHEEAVPGENPGSETAAENVNTLHLVGAKRIAPALQELVLKVNESHVGFEFEYDMESVYERSDHYNFARKGIPIAFFFTGFHRDYHKPTDDVEKIDFKKLARVAQLVYLTAWELAERPQRLPVEKGRKPREDK